MDQTIRKILELDAATEERLSASRLQCRKKVEDARKQAAAMKQAQKHQTRDSITELEEQTRSECEQKIAELRGSFDRGSRGLFQVLPVEIREDYCRHGGVTGSVCVAADDLRAGNPAGIPDLGRIHTVCSE